MNTKEDDLKCKAHRPTQRVLAILEELAGNTEGISLTQLAGKIGSSKGTIFPILGTLLSTGYALRDKDSNLYRLGRSLFMLSESTRSEEALFGQVLACMREVMESCAEICQLGVLSGREVLYIAKVESREPAIQIVSHVGSRLPAQSTALGKALLCEYSRAGLESLFAAGSAEQQRAGINMDKLWDELQKIKQGAPATDFGEINEHLYCYALPVRYNGAVDCAISVSLPSFRATPEKQRLIEEALQQARGKLEIYMHNQHLSFRV
jgi:DNA-binding IclR family transcriptional regulator